MVCLIKSGALCIPSTSASYSNLNSSLWCVNSHTSGVHFLKLKAWHGQWNTKLLETAFTTSFTHCARYEAHLGLLTLGLFIKIYLSMHVFRCCCNFQVYHRRRYWCLNMRSPCIYMLKACLYACTGWRNIHAWTLVTCFVKNIKRWFLQISILSNTLLKILILDTSIFKRQVIYVNKKGAILTTESQFVFRIEWSFVHKCS